MSLVSSPVIRLRLIGEQLPILNFLLKKNVNCIRHDIHIVLDFYCTGGVRKPGVLRVVSLPFSLFLSDLTVRYLGFVEGLTY